MKLDIAAMLLCMGVLGFVSGVNAQQASVPAAAPIGACGIAQPVFNVKTDKAASPTIQAPDGKALVYMIEQMPSMGLISTKVAVGVDGAWVGITKPQTYISFTLDPGLHHICTRYQGEAAVGEEGQTILHRLNVEAGKTYYLLYRGIFDRSSGEVAFLDEVDEDEGSYLLQSSEHVISTAKK